MFLFQVFDFIRFWFLGRHLALGFCLENNILFYTLISCVLRVYDGVVAKVHVRRPPLVLSY